MPDESAVTVVTIAHGRHDHLVRQREVLREVAAGVPHVVVAMEDPEIGRLLEGDPDVVLREVPADALGLHPRAQAHRRRPKRWCGRGC